MRKAEIIHRVYYNETDQMGRVYHSNYLVWMEKARTEWLRECGISYKDLENMGIMLPVSDLSIKYLNAVEYDEEVHIHIYPGKLNRIKVDFKYEFYNKDKSIQFAESNSTNVFTDKDGKIKRISKELFEKIKQ
jgi:acyl-CoA thioester hydrolase